MYVCLLLGRPLRAANFPQISYIRDLISRYGNMTTVIGWKGAHRLRGCFGTHKVQMYVHNVYIEQDYNTNERPIWTWARHISSLSQTTDIFTTEIPTPINSRAHILIPQIRFRRRYDVDGLVVSMSRNERWKGTYRLRIGTAAVSALIPFQYIVPTSVARYDGVILLSTVDFRLVKGNVAHCLLKCFLLRWWLRLWK